MNLRTRWLGALALACISLANVCPARAAPLLASCNNSTINGTVVSSAINRTRNWAYLAVEFWDGAGKGTYAEIDSSNGFSSGWYSGTITYSISSNCVVNEEYNDGYGLYPYLFYVNPDGTGLEMVGGQNGDGTWVTSGDAISKRSLVSATNANPACSKKTLKGTYSTSANEALTGSVKNIMMRWSFDGAGKLTYRNDVFVAGTKTHSSGFGTYAVNANCQVSIFYGLGSNPVYAAVLAPAGTAFWWLNIENTGTTSVGKAKRVSMLPVDNSDVLGL